LTRPWATSRLAEFVNASSNRAANAVADQRIVIATGNAAIVRMAWTI
jgi:hypothetical protein